MKFQLGVALAALFALASPAAAANCEARYDTLAQAIAGPVTMDEGHRAAMSRLALSAYDYCLAGDTRRSGDVEAMLMKKLKELDHR